MKKIIAILSVCTLSLSLFAACGAAPSSTATTSGSTSAAGDRPKLTLFVDETWWPYDKWTGAVPEAFSELAGVDVEVIRAVDDKQLPLMIASGDMPDIVCSPRPERMADSQVSYALDELHTQFPDIAFPVHSVYQFLNKAADGHYYTIGCDYSPQSVYEANPGILMEGPGLLFRQDILEELGNPAIKSLTDLENLFAQVKKAYPDLYPAVFNSVHKFNWVKMMMGIPLDPLYSDGDTIKWNLRHEEQLNYYKTINRWYREGYLIPENFAFKTEDETKELIFSGKAFANFGYVNNADNYNPILTQNGEDFQLTQFDGILGDSAKRYNSTAGGRGLYITKSCKDLEAAYRFVAAAYSDEGMKLLSWGVKDTDYTVDDRGYPKFNYDKENNAELEARGLKYWGWLVGNAYVNGVTNYNTGGQMLSAMENLATITEHNPVVGMIRFTPDSDEAVISAKIRDMVTTEEIKVFMANSEAECEAAFNEMLATAEELGMSSLEEYANKNYPALRAEYDKIANNKE